MVWQTQVLTNANAAAKTSKSLLQEAVARALDEAAKAEARAAAAEAKASRALRDAEQSQSLTKGSLTKADLVAMVQAEWIAQQDGITNAGVDQIRDEFPAGLGAQRIDKDRTRQLRSDADNFNDAARGGIG